jgi:hypothetical protein
MPEILISFRGGKVAMAVALSPDLPSGLLHDLIVADIAPSRASLSSEFQGYVKAMNEIEAAKVSTRPEAQDILKRYEPVCFAKLLLTKTIAVA